MCTNLLDQVTINASGEEVAMASNSGAQSAPAEEGSFFTNKWFWIGVGVLALGAAAAGGSDSGGGGSDPTATLTVNSGDL